MQYIIAKQIELSGSKDARDLKALWFTGDTEAVGNKDAEIEELLRKRGIM